MAFGSATPGQPLVKLTASLGSGLPAVQCSSLTAIKAPSGLCLTNIYTGCLHDDTPCYIFLIGLRNQRLRSLDRRMTAADVLNTFEPRGCCAVLVATFMTCLLSGQKRTESKASQGGLQKIRCSETARRREAKVLLCSWEALRFDLSRPFTREALCCMCSCQWNQGQPCQ